MASDVSPDVWTQFLFPLKLSLHFHRLAVKQPPVDTGRCVLHARQSQPDPRSAQGQVLGDAGEGTA